MSKLSIQPISPLDGRYRAAVSDLGFHLSEAGLNRARIAVEVEWLIQLSTRNLLETNAEINHARNKAYQEIGEKLLALAHGDQHGRQYWPDYLVLL